MSIHSIVKSQITDYETLTTILNESGIAWQPIDGFNKGTGRALNHAIEAVIGRETVMIWQGKHGDAFRFQSEGWTFRNKSGIKELASGNTEANRRRQEQLEQQRRLEDQRRQEEERRRREEAERLRRIEEERRRIEEIERQKQLSSEADQVLSRLDSTFRKPDPLPPVAPPPPVTPAPVLPAAVDEVAKQQSADKLEALVGKMHQENARRKILENLEQFQDRGLNLESSETLQDQTVELRFRG